MIWGETATHISAFGVLLLQVGTYKRRFVEQAAGE
jgi:hypothetical protein